MNLLYLLTFCRHAPRERVSWNLCNRQNKSLSTGHAPRERVSWNSNAHNYYILRSVTLHVSVWVEMFHYLANREPLKSRSTWACELKFGYSLLEELYLRHAPRERVSWNLECTFHCQKIQVTLHVSVWVEICKEFYKNCKYSSHAPRERVSWNSCFCCLNWNTSASRSTWACELKLYGKKEWVEMKTSRSTWACELKSWGGRRSVGELRVTLHMSVWVEIIE